MKQFLSEMRALIKQLLENPDMTLSYQLSDPDRDFVVSDNKLDVFKTLDRLSTLYSRNSQGILDACGQKTHDDLQEIMRIGVAKIDYSLIEKGKDFSEMIHKLHGKYYDRKRDLKKCGYSMDLIEYILKEYSIKIDSSEDSPDCNTTAQRQDFMSTIEFKDALRYGLCDIRGVLQVDKARYSRFAVVRYDIDHNYKGYWLRFDRIFIDRKGKAVPFQHFLQSSRDQGLDVLRDKAEEEYRLLNTSEN